MLFMGMDDGSSGCKSSVIGENGKTVCFALTKIGSVRLLKCMPALITAVIWTLLSPSTGRERLRSTGNTAVWAISVYIRSMFRSTQAGSR